MRVIVVGAGKSGVAAAKLLLKQGADVTLADAKPKRELADTLEGLPSAVRIKAGSPAFFSEKTDLMIVSPGIPWNHPELAKAHRRGIPVWPEMELGWRNVHPHKTIAITGTNGKTTTTALIGHILKQAKRPTVIGGNIGVPLSALVDEITSATFLVLEVSSYQLEAHQTFHPNVGVFLNLTPDHLARHQTMAGYAAAKARMFSAFSDNDTAVLNGNDPWCRRVAKKIHGEKVFFPNPIDRVLAKNLTLPGQHNQENAMAAAAACRAVGLSRQEIVAGLKTFRGVPHRIQIVRTWKGVRYVNDSKATNVDSTLMALRSFTDPMVLMLGGQHKGSPYKPLIPLIKKRVKAVLTMGEAAPVIEKDLGRHVSVFPCETLERAVKKAQELAVSGNVVLLSPACASFDQFKNFEHRGEEFVRLVSALK